MNIKKINKPQNPNLTIDLNNDELEQKIVAYGEDKTADNLNLLINCIVRCRVLVPAKVNDKKQPYPCTIKSNSGEYFLPLYTSKGQIPKTPKSAAMMNMPYLALNQMAVKQKEQIAGIVINPYSDNLVFKSSLLEKIDATHKEKKPLTEEQYVLVARRIFESQILPKKFFEEKEEFVNRLCEEKEVFIDQLFEESYQNKRLYPYLEEDFSVMFMDVSDELLMVRLDLPARDMTLSACFRVYFVWNKEEKTGRYFTIEKGQNSKNLAEITAERNHVNHGEAPVEGAELQKIIDLLDDTKHHTS